MPTTLTQYDHFELQYEEGSSHCQIDCQMLLLFLLCFWIHPTLVDTTCIEIRERAVKTTAKA